VTAVRHVLLLTQSGVCGLVAIGALVFALASRSPEVGFLAVLSGALALLPALVAGGLGAGWGWARGLGVLYELLLLVSGVTNTLVLRNDDLVSTAVNVVLPATLLWLLLRRPPTMGTWSSAGSPAGSIKS